MPTVNLTIGKLRGLGQCATRRGAFSVLALDHRHNLRQLLRPDAPDSVPPGELVTFKQQVVGALAPAASAVLLDPEFGAAQCIASGALPGNVGLLVAVEATGYIGDPGARQSWVLPGWSIGQDPADGRQRRQAVGVLPPRLADCPRDRVARPTSCRRVRRTRPALVPGAIVLFARPGPQKTRIWRASPRGD